MPAKGPTLQVPSPSTAFEGTVATEWPEQPDIEKPSQPSDAGRPRGWYGARSRHARDSTSSKYPECLVVVLVLFIFRDFVLISVSLLVARLQSVTGRVRPAA